MTAYNPNSLENQSGVPIISANDAAVRRRKYIKLKKTDDNRNCQCFLDDRKKKFCDEFLKTGDIAYAAKIAGYKSNNPYRLLKTPIISQYLKLQADKNLNVTKDWYISKLTKVVENGIPEERIPENERLYSTRDALTAGDQISRLKGFYEPDKTLNVNANLNDYKDLLDKIKEKERGY